MKNILMKIKDSSVVLYSLLIGIVFIFDRSIVGFMISGQQVGKLIVGIGFLATFLFIILRFYNLNLLNLDDYSLSLSILSAIVLTFFISIFLYGTNIFSAYTFRTSSYI